MGSSITVGTSWFGEKVKVDTATPLNVTAFATASTLHVVPENAADITKGKGPGMLALKCLLQVPTPLLTSDRSIGSEHSFDPQITKKLLVYHFDGYNSHSHTLKQKWFSGGEDGRRRRRAREELVTPNHFRCPISLDLMKDPVTLSTGITYDRESIERWFEEGNLTCPLTNQIVTHLDFIPNHTLRMMIQDWCVDNRTRGVQRIPTPPVPITPKEVQHLLLTLYSVSKASPLDPHACLPLLQAIQKWGAESERNTRCMEDNGLPRALASAFHAFANPSHSTLLHHILSLLNSMFPREFQALQHLGSEASLRCMVWFLRQQDLSWKETSIVALRNLVSFGDHRHVEALAEIQGMNQVLAKFLNRRMLFGQTIAKASLAVVWHLVCSSERMRLKFIQVGMVCSMLEIVLESEGEKHRNLTLSPCLDLLIYYLRRRKGEENGYLFPVICNDGKAKKRGKKRRCHPHTKTKKREESHVRFVKTQATLYTKARPPI
ncbi:U-box domain-containing protein 21-like [Cajanus cajan]|uniref:U-box domain-containing protein 21-like n=1 Tax=Cajanus cajan TaxID=3821 RepID=UPI0010FBA43C|nr:U-box domain-containing protein 21-like [Cajanus cajan]